MAIPFSILHGPDGDIDLSKGLRFTTSTKQYAAQRLDCTLSFFLGEWFLNKLEGLPYWERIIGATPDLGLLETIYRRAILGSPAIASLPALTLAFDRSTRTLSPTFRAIVKDGETITQADLAKSTVIDI